LYQKKIYLILNFKVQNQVAILATGSFHDFLNKKRGDNFYNNNNIQKKNENELNAAGSRKDRFI
jgi:hypothetical protein